MRLFRQSFVLIMVLIICISNAQAVKYDEIYEHNQYMANQWVNWMPSSWISSESVAQLADQIFSESTKEDFPRNVHRWVCENIYYDWDAYEKDTYFALSAPDVLRQKRGICEGIANLVQAIFLEEGIPCIKVWGVLISEEDSWEETDSDWTRINHTWNEFYWEGRWIAIDCTMDMRNGYRNGEYTALPCDDSYFDPEDAFFAETHKVLRRGYDLPQNIPDEWAKQEIKKGVDLHIVPTELLSDYRNVVTEAEFMMLLGLDGGGNQPISRLDAALIVASLMGDKVTDAAEIREEIVSPYEDTIACAQEERDSLNLLFREGIMIGAGSQFFPENNITRQEAIAVFTRLFVWGKGICT